MRMRKANSSTNENNQKHGGEQLIYTCPVVPGERIRIVL